MRWLLFLLLVCPIWAAESPPDQSLALTPVRMAYGELALELNWDAYGPELRPGGGWVTLGDRVRVPAIIRREGTAGARISSQSPLSVRELAPVLEPVLCSGEGALRVKVRDLFCNEVEWEAPPERVHWSPGSLLEEVRRQVCGLETWATIPAGEPITDLAAFLAGCPAPDDLALLQQDFPLLFQPPQLPPPATTTCQGAALSPAGLLLYQALDVIRHMELTHPLPWTSLHPYHWFEEKVGGIVISFSAEESYCCAGVLLPQGAPGRALVLSRKDPRLWPSRPGWYDPESGAGLLPLILELVRLARGVERPSDCGHRDSGPDYLGPWGVAWALARKLAEGDIRIGLTPEQREETALYASQLLSSRFCH
jgi:hypothetical protein